MKRTIVGVAGIVFVMGLASPAHAMKAALKVGVNYADLGGEDDPDMDPSLRYAGGLVFSPTGPFGLEVIYSQKGAQEDLGGGSMYYIEGEYAQATFLARLGGQNARLVLGGYAAFKLGKAREILEGGGMTVTDESIDDDIKDLDFGAVAGLSFGGRQATFDVRYEMGLTSIDDSSSPSDIVNEVITAGVTIRF